MHTCVFTCDMGPGFILSHSQEPRGLVQVMFGLAGAQYILFCPLKFEAFAICRDLGRGNWAWPD